MITEKYKFVDHLTEHIKRRVERLIQDHREDFDKIVERDESGKPIVRE